MIEEAKATLLRALEELECAEDDLGGPSDRVDLVVIYAVGRNTEDGSWDEVGGWASTPGPKWVHAALLYRAAAAHDDSASSIDDS